MLLFQGNSADLCIPDKIVDAIITDPPYFDYIHYSELSDFFYAWLSLALKGRYQEFSPSNSSAEGEVQQHDPVVFAEKLSEVFRECNRVLKEDGLLIFSFHHSKAEGWAAISNALTESGFIVTAIHPVYSEFIGSSIKSVSNDPISSDTIIVCRKHEYVINCTNSIPDVSKLLERHSSSLSGTNYKVLKAASMLIEFTRNKRDYQFALAELIKIYSNQDES